MLRLIHILTEIQLTLLIGLLPELLLVLQLQPISLQFRADLLIFFSEFFHLSPAFFVSGVDALQTHINKRDEFHINFVTSLLYILFV